MKREEERESKGQTTKQAGKQTDRQIYIETERGRKGGGQRKKKRKRGLETERKVNKQYLSIQS